MLHCVIEFRQINWLEDYISKNTFLSELAPNDFEKNFY